MFVPGRLGAPVIAEQYLRVIIAARLNGHLHHSRTHVHRRRDRSRGEALSTKLHSTGGDRSCADAYWIYRVPDVLVRLRESAYRGVRRARDLSRRHLDVRAWGAWLSGLDVRVACYRVRALPRGRRPLDAQ